MSDPLRVFVNERPVSVPAGATAMAAVLALDPDLGARLASGGAYLTDGRGVRVTPDSLVAAGAILRVIVPARGASDADA